MSKTRVRNPAAAANHQAKRIELVGRIADALLARGVAQIALRELADELGTSDRMLLYYFEDKEALVKASLAEVSTRLSALLGSGFPDRKSSAAKILRKAIPLFATPAIAPFMTVWADIAARGSRREEPFMTVARDSVHQWLQWLEVRLDFDETAARRDMAVAILTILEGTRLLDSTVPGASKSAARVLLQRLDDDR
jgi:AcrR family transcriptional regulator